MNASTCYSSSIVYLIILHSVFILLNSSRPIATTSISDQKHSLQVRILNLNVSNVLVSKLWLWLYRFFSHSFQKKIHFALIKTSVLVTWIGHVYITRKICLKSIPTFDLNFFPWNVCECVLKLIILTRYFYLELHCVMKPFLESVRKKKN